MSLRWKLAKLLYGKTAEQTLAKRFKIFVLVAVGLIAISKLLYLSGAVPIPNFELIIPTMVVIGSLSLYCGNSKSWNRLVRYFGIIALFSVYLADLAFWGPNPIYAFTWSGFIIVWLISMKNKLSTFDRFKKLLYKTTLTAAVGILLFDIWTAFGCWLGWGEKSIAGLIAIYLAQIPFTLYHLASLVFVPPLLGLGKLMMKVRVPVSVAVNVGSGVRTKEK
ncbi:MAG: hypothetical protein H5T49_03460 [Hadesarchaea archaeon]|nr:hypothetical protein [Hadesarchaea archaeon]